MRCAAWSARTRRWRRPPRGSPRRRATSPRWSDAGQRDLLAGEAELARRAGAAVRRGTVRRAAGWAPSEELPALSERLAAVGARPWCCGGPRLVDPPTLLRPRAAGAAVPAAGRDLRDRALRRRRPDAVRRRGLRADVRDDVRRRRPRACCWCSPALLLRPAGRAGWPALRPVWPFVVGAGAGRRVFGLLYGEFFGPTGVVPVLWLAPLEEPVTAARARRSAWVRCCSPAPTRSARSTGGARAAGRWPCTPPPGSPGRAVRRRSGVRRCWVLDAARAWLVGPGVVVALAGAGAGLRRLPRRRRAAARPASPQALGRAVRRGAAARLQPGVLRPAGGLRADPRGARPGRVGGHASPCGAAAARRLRRRGRRLRRRQRGRLRAGGAGRRRAGAAAGVLRAVLPRVRRRGPAVPALARPASVRDAVAARSMPAEAP